MQRSADRFNELEGRIEGISQLLLYLTAQLEIDNSLDGNTISKSLRHKTGSIKRLDPPVLQSAQRVMLHLADCLDAARTERQKQGH